MSKDKLRQDARQEMYKNNGQSPNWKDKFRMRCLERLKDSRRKFLFSKRSIDSQHENDLTAPNICHENELEETTTQRSIQKGTSEIDIIMREEFDRLKGDVSVSEYSRKSTVDDDLQGQGIKGNCYLAAKNNPQGEYHLSSVGIKDDGSCQSDDHKNDYLNIEALDVWYKEIYDILKAEMEEARKKEEELYLENLQKVGDEYIKYDDELCSALQALSTEEVICPLCQKFNLIEQKTVIFCRCGLRINTEQDNITLKFVKDSLAMGATEHSQKCESKPVFSLYQNFGVSNLLMSCHDCDFMFVIV